MLVVSAAVSVHEGVGQVGFEQAGEADHTYARFPINLVRSRRVEGIGYGFNDIRRFGYGVTKQKPGLEREVDLRKTRVKKTQKLSKLLITLKIAGNKIRALKNCTQMLKLLNISTSELSTISCLIGLVYLLKSLDGRMSKAT